MIHYLKGKITITEKDFVVIEVNGVGYKVFVTPDTKEDLPEKTTLFCYEQKTDRDSRLYGFKDKENLEFFEKLINISGIGPKTAVQIASIASLEEIKEGIKKEDKRIMNKIFSVGKKKGQQVIFELSRKFIKEPKKDEVFDALKELGFSQAEIKNVLEEIPSKGSKEKRTKEALRVLGNNG